MRHWTPLRSFTSAGVSTIVGAIDFSRKVFQRMEGLRARCGFWFSSRWRQCALDSGRGGVGISTLLFLPVHANSFSPTSVSQHDHPDAHALAQMFERPTHM